MLFYKSLNMQVGLREMNALFDLFFFLIQNLSSFLCITYWWFGSFTYSLLNMQRCANSGQIHV